jgi:hypothetical protein
MTTINFVHCLMWLEMWLNLVLKTSLKTHICSSEFIIILKIILHNINFVKIIIVKPKNQK